MKDINETFPSDYQGIPYKQLVETLEDQLGGVPSIGSRHDFLLSISCHLRSVCDDNPQWIAAVLPQDLYGIEHAEAVGIIESACRLAKRPGMSRALRAALKACRAAIRNAAVGEPLPPPLPERLPRAIALLTSKVPDIYKPAVATAVFPPLAAHLFGVRFRYNDNSEMEPSLMCLTMAKMSSGKSCVNKPIEYIMRDIDDRDRHYREMQQMYNETTNNKKANERGEKRKKFVICHLATNVTNAAFVQRLDDAGGRFLYSNMNELDMLNDLCTSSRMRPSGIVRLAWDCDIYGQERVGTLSVTATPQLRWNWNASTTIQRGQNYFRNSLVDGTLSRINICTIIAPSGNALPVYGVYDKKFADRLAPYIANMKQYDGRGVVACSKANRLVEEMLAENNDKFVLSEDEARLQLSYRSVAIAFKKVMVLYLMNGGRWEKAFDDFFRWSVRYDLWCKMRFFGNQLAQGIEEETKNLSTGPQNMLELLPDRFTRDELESLRRTLGKNSNPSHTIATWKSRGLIGLDEVTGKYFKTKKYLDAHAA